QGPLNPAGKLNLTALLAELGRRGCNDVLVETGAHLAGAFVNAGLVDELVLYCAPTLLGSEARPLLTLGLQQMNEQIRWHWHDVRMVGGDLRMTLRRWTIDAGRWTLDAGRWTLDAGRWTFFC